MEPTPAGIRVMDVEDNGLRGEYCVPRSMENGAGIVFIGGSQGGLAFAAPAARRACEEGFAALALAYWRYEDRPDTLEAIPIEYFKRGVDWLAARPETDDSRIGLTGYSRGGEAALLTTLTSSRVQAVAALVPASYVGAGIDFQDFFNLEAAWTMDGEPVPFASTRQNKPGADWQQMMTNRPEPTPESRIAEYEALKATPAYQRARIPVEHLDRPVFLVGAGGDTVWASAVMVRDMQARLRKRPGTTKQEMLISSNAPHAFMLDTGTDEGQAPNLLARDAWARMFQFFRLHLAPPRSQDAVNSAPRPE
jgi:dienelactone hydrolase